MRDLNKQKISSKASTGSCQFAQWSSAQIENYRHEMERGNPDCKNGIMLYFQKWKGISFLWFNKRQSKMEQNWVIDFSQKYFLTFQGNDL